MMGNSAIAYICAFCVVLGGIAPGQGIVLCIGEDGRVQLEAAHGGACSEPCPTACHDTCRPEADDHETPGRHCGACTDIPLAGGLPEHEVTVPNSRSADFRADACRPCPSEDICLASADASVRALDTRRCPSPCDSFLLETTILLI